MSIALVAAVLGFVFVIIMMIRPAAYATKLEDKIFRNAVMAIDQLSEPECFSKAWALVQEHAVGPSAFEQWAEWEKLGYSNQFLDQFFKNYSRLVLGDDNRLVDVTVLEESIINGHKYLTFSLNSAGDLASAIKLADPDKVYEIDGGIEVEFAASSVARCILIDHEALRVGYL